MGKRLLMALLGIVLALAIAEAALRFVGKKYTGSTYIADPVLGWALRPGAGAWEADEGVAWTRINSHGYRDRERTLSKPRGGYRIAVLGDSYTEARQVAMDRTFTALAEEALNRRRCVGEGSVEVLNFGVPGYGTAQELLQLRERVWQFGPDMIVLQFHAGNDMYNNYRALNISGADLAPYFVLKDGRLSLDESFRHGRAFHPVYITLKRMGADITNSSVVLQVIYKGVRLYAHRQAEARLQAATRATPSADPTAPPPEYQNFLGYLPPAMPSMVEAWRVTEALITEFGNEVRAHGVPLLLMIMPTRHQVHPDPKFQDAYRAKYGIESLEYADDRVDRHAAARGIPVLRPTKALVDEARRTGTYVGGFANTAPNDGHLNERGHAVVARELVEAICRLARTRGRRRAQAHDPPVRAAAGRPW